MDPFYSALTVWGIIFDIVLFVASFLAIGVLVLCAFIAIMLVLAIALDWIERAVGAIRR